MPGILIASPQPRAGKTLCACSLGVLLQKRGYNVGFLKPLGSDPKNVEDGVGDADALVVQEVLGQHILPETLSPVMMPRSWSSLPILPFLPGSGLCCPGTKREEEEKAVTAIKKAYAEIAAGKDLMLVSGTGSFPGAGSYVGADGLTLVKELDLQVLLMTSFDSDFDYDSLHLARKMLGERLLGVVLNKVPEGDIPLCRQTLVPYLESHCIPVLGIIPHEPELNVIRCLNLAYALKGRIVAGNEGAVGGVTSFVLGTMQVENFMLQMRGRKNCAVVLGGDRTDLQLAAMHGKGNCLVLTGNLGPDELVRSRAEQLGVPVIVVKEDSYAAARNISRLLTGQKFHDLEQINKGIRLFETSVEVDEIIECLPGFARSIG